MVDGKPVLIKEGGEVYATGAAWVLGEFHASFERVRGLDDVHVINVSAGFSHSGAVTSDGEVYTWGSNVGGGTGHPMVLKFIPTPTILDCFRSAPVNLALRRPARQSSTFNMRNAYLAVNGCITGLGEEQCTHTQYDIEPWWEVDLGEVCTIDRIVVYNRRDVDMPPGVKPDYYSSRLFPSALLLSPLPFPSKTGEGVFMKSKAVAQSYHSFTKPQYRSVWKCPPATVARFVR